MAKAPLRLSTSQHHGTVTVTVAGELDVATSPDLKSHLDRVLLAEPSQVIIHLSHCSFIDAGGLGTLVAFKNRAKLRQTGLLLSGIPARMLRLMQLIGLDRGFEILPPMAGESATAARSFRALRSPGSAARPGRGDGRRRKEAS
jgi:anti-sigma B factor antagonist